MSRVSVASRWCLGGVSRWLWQSMLATTCWEKPFAGPFGNCWCVSCWCLGRLSIVFRWSLVSWWHFGGGSVVSWRCSVMFWVPCLCFGCVSVVCWCLGGIEGIVFPKASPMLGFSFRLLCREGSETEEPDEQGRKEGREGRKKGTSTDGVESVEIAWNSLEIAWGGSPLEGARWKRLDGLWSMEIISLGELRWGELRWRERAGSAGRAWMDCEAWNSLGGSAGRERCKNAKLVARVFRDNFHQCMIGLKNCGSKTWK